MIAAGRQRHRETEPGVFQTEPQDFLGGTFFPSFLALESPMAIACLGLVTFLPLRPDLSLPFFISLISVSTFLPAEGEYFRPEDFFADDFFADDFLVEGFFALGLLLVLLFFEELLFFAAFFVAICPPRKSDVHRIRVSCMTVEDGRAFMFATRDYTTRRTPGSRTNGSANSQHAMHAGVPATPNFTSAGATQW